MNENVTAERYRGFLSRVYGFESPVEWALQRTAGVEGVLDLRGRAHLKLLASDLLSLGLASVDKLSRCRNVSAFASVEDALGWTYVIERNMLLHGVLLRHLEQKLPAQVVRASSYLARNERSAGRRMRELGAALDATAKTPGGADRILVAAHAAFRCQQRWFADAVPQHARVA